MRSTQSTFILKRQHTPVSLSSFSCNVLEHIVHSSIMYLFIKKDIFCDNQHGFRSKPLCDTQLPSKHLRADHYRPISKTQSNGIFDSPIVGGYCMLTRLSLQYKELLHVVSSALGRARYVILRIQLYWSFKHVQQSQLLHKLNSYGVRNGSNNF